MSKKILFVDDDANILSSYQRQLRKEFTMDIALGGEPALAMIQEKGPYAVIVSDMQMPGMNGIEFLTKVEAKAPDTVRIMLTGNADQKTAVEAVNRGHIFRFLTKPCEIEAMTQTLRAGLKQYALVTAERELLEKTLQGSIKVLTEILSLLDPNSFSRAERLRDYMTACAKAFNISKPWELEMAASLSQIGYAAIPPSVLTKINNHQILSKPENDLIARVPETGFNLLSNIPRLENVANIVRYQCKNFDGSGFPLETMAGESIPIGSRILKVLTDMLVLEGQRLSKFKALEKMRQHPDRYDPKVLEFVASAFDLFLPGTEPTSGAGRPFMFNELRVGQTLMSDVMTLDGTKIVVAGTEITSVLLEKLRNFSTLSGIKEPILAAD